MSRLDKMVDAGGGQRAVQAAMAPTAPPPAKSEIDRQNAVIIELFRRIDALATAMVQLGAQPPPFVKVDVPVQNVQVDAPVVNVPAPVVNVAAPSVTVEAPSVSVEAPNVSVAAPVVHVAAPNVSVEAPNVNVAAPNVSVEQAAVNFNPSISVAQHMEWEFKHYYDDFSGRPTRTVARVVDQTALDS